ncbi:MAG: sarcosine oxidase subunit delta [Candidatus Latescibacteria bacterium]|nr:sarcosine oxidase subunit delta [Gemmatimonadaceae bacterium]MDP6015174.1 sarcosine oxidase subunit delta [Candidatus Latescibacterota bacterium]MDP7450548.1 sarcosine oxidase subunit delta [Candidatus Latescibacterota bacterium]HJP33058.1 sarcosine oxidase subunit delta [Candidatus Latescibacterota bacterium]
MLRLECPHCGVRNSAEFRYGGEYRPRPAPSTEAAESEWIGYLYQRHNGMGEQIEWWYHRAGCGTWFLVERDRRSNEVARTWLWQPADAAAQKEATP